LMWNRSNRWAGLPVWAAGVASSEHEADAHQARGAVPDNAASD
jgi:hypothetical protein